MANICHNRIITKHEQTQNAKPCVYFSRCIPRINIMWSHLFNWTYFDNISKLFGVVTVFQSPITVCVIWVSIHYRDTVLSLQWRHNEQDYVSNHQPHDCLLNCLFGRGSKRTSKLRVTGLCVGNSPGPVNSPHKWPVTRKMFPFDDVIMVLGFACKAIWLWIKGNLCTNGSRAQSWTWIRSYKLMEKGMNNSEIKYRLNAYNSWHTVPVPYSRAVPWPPFTKP